MKPYRSTALLLDVVVHLVKDHCSTAAGIDTGSLRSQFHAVRVLAEYKLVVIEYEHGNRILAQWHNKNMAVHQTKVLKDLKL